jgi:aquaporin Z
MSPTLARSVAAEFLGTALLVFLAVGSAVGGIKVIGALGVALAFGLVLLALAYAIGPISGCHINPAVTLGVLLAKGMTASEAAYYWVAQFAGGIAGAAVLKLMTSGFGDVTDQTGTLGSNDWGKNISLGGAFVLEVLLTFVFVAVILLVTGRSATPGFAGLAIGLALTAVHLVGIPLDGTSVNPARSLGPALFAGGVSLAHVWLFLVAPLIGGALAVAGVRGLSTPLVTEEAALEAEAVTGGASVDQTGAQLPAEEVQIPAPAPAHDDTGARTTGGHRRRS